MDRLCDIVITELTSRCTEYPTKVVGSLKFRGEYGRRAGDGGEGRGMGAGDGMWVTFKTSLDFILVLVIH